MNTYEENAIHELGIWERKMIKKPSFTNVLTKWSQDKVNTLIPNKVHQVITGTIKSMVKAVLIGSEYITRQPLINESLEVKEGLVSERLNFYRKAAVISGAGTGAGGILLGLADLPLLVSLKMKFLFDAASLYGFDVRDYKERLYILYVFQLAFSSKQGSTKIYQQILNWDNFVKGLPMNIDLFDWRTFQQEYRDYIDLVKMLQLIPGIGAAVGAYANYQLMDKLGETATNAYRLRFFRMEMEGNIWCQ